MGDYILQWKFTSPFEPQQATYYKLINGKDDLGSA